MVYNTIKKLSTLISMDNRKPHPSTATYTVWQMNCIKTLNKVLHCFHELLVGWLQRTLVYKVLVSQSDTTWRNSKNVPDKQSPAFAQVRIVCMAKR